MGKYLVISLCETCVKDEGFVDEVYNDCYGLDVDMFITRSEGLISRNTYVKNSRVNERKNLRKWAEIVAEEVYRACILYQKRRVVLLGRGVAAYEVCGCCRKRGVDITIPIAGMGRKVAERFIKQESVR